VVLVGYKIPLRQNHLKQHKSETGILMIFGDENKNKKFKYVEKVDGLKVYGRGSNRHTKHKLIS
jgi:hypothetical protein